MYIYIYIDIDLCIYLLFFCKHIYFDFYMHFYSLYLFIHAFVFAYSISHLFVNYCYHLKNLLLVSTYMPSRTCTAHVYIYICIHEINIYTYLCIHMYI